MLSMILKPLTLIILYIHTVYATVFTGIPAAKQGWQLLSRAPRDGLIELHIALRQEDGGTDIVRQLLKASDPKSQAFRQHLGPAQTLELGKPADLGVRVVKGWLEQHDLLAQATISGAIVDVKTNISEAEALLNTTYSVFSDSAQDLIRTNEYQVPDHVAPYIDFVTPTTHFPEPAAVMALPELQSQPNQDLRKRENCGRNDSTTPACVRQVYGVNFDGLNYTIKPDRTHFGVYATEGAIYNSSATEEYLRQYNPPAADANASYIVDGEGNPDIPGGLETRFETSLCTQAALGLAWPLQGTLYNRGGAFGTNAGQTYDPFVSFLQELISNETVPSVVSISQSITESRMDPDYARRLCNMMAQVGTRGVSLLFSSGNNGANGDLPGNGDHKEIFEPRFPASCPWVTAVGGTTDLSDEKAATQETITGISRTGFAASGGGFSNLFSQPSYQSDAVQGYLSQHIPDDYQTLSGFNDSGRGIPDVSAFSTMYPTYVGGFVVPIGGTSAATPTWAAIIALLNDYEAFHGRPSLGFINPFLYNLTSALNDITEGGNNVGDCQRLQGCNLGTIYGYNVTEGWDPVTGLGSPRFRELIRALDGLPP